MNLQSMTKMQPEQNATKLRPTKIQSNLENTKKSLWKFGLQMVLDKYTAVDELQL